MLNQGKEKHRRRTFPSGACVLVKWSEIFPVCGKIVVKQGNRRSKNCGDFLFDHLRGIPFRECPFVVLGESPCAGESILYHFLIENQEDCPFLGAVLPIFFHVILAFSFVVSPK